MIRETELGLRHYGSSKYDANLVHPIQDQRCRNKPIGGLWTSPIGAEFGWKEWCEVEDYAICEGYFDLRFRGRVLEIACYADLVDLHWVWVGKGCLYPTFENLEVDAIHLTTSGARATRLLEPMNLYGWDCESVLIFNKESVEEV